MDFCDSLSDKIFQPTPRPLRANVRPFLFHIYDPTWEAPLDFSAKEFGMVYVGHTKFRWHGMSQGAARAWSRCATSVGRIAPGRRGLGQADRIGRSGWRSADDY